MPEKIAPVRKRDAEATRLAIVQAAQLVFTDKGFDQAGTREIADKACVNVALINRYFGSKQGLFTESVLPALTVSSAQLGDVGDLAPAMTALLMNKPAEIRFDPIIAMLRSTSSETVGALLREHVETKIIQPIADHVGGADGRERACVALSIFYGYDVLVRMMGQRPYDDPDRKALEARLNAAFSAALA